MNSISKEPTKPLWDLGFRPFFLLAITFAILVLAVWIGVFFNFIAPIGYFDPILWHAHEMIYGYTTAVIAGFVLTASQNWTGLRGIHGKRLKILVGIWILGRTAMCFSRTHSTGLALAFSISDLLFYPCLSIVLYPYLKPSDMKIERVFFAYFAMYLAGNLLMHFQALGIVQNYALRGALLGLHTTILMIIFMGGRVIPFFTSSEKAKAQPKTWAPIEILSNISAWLFAITQAFDPNSRISATFAFFASAINFVRLAGWQVRRIRRVPLLWVLHVSYLWMILGFALSGFVSLGIVSIGPAVHAFAVGGLGVMTYGMISRISLGHTGRRLHPTLLTVIGYILLNLSVAFRVLGPLIDSRVYHAAILISGGLWMTSFLILFAGYFRILTEPRVD